MDLRSKSQPTQAQQWMRTIQKVRKKRTKEEKAAKSIRHEMKWNDFGWNRTFFIHLLRFIQPDNSRSNDAGQWEKINAFRKQIIHSTEWPFGSINPSLIFNSHYYISYLIHALFIFILLCIGSLEQISLLLSSSVCFDSVSCNAYSYLLYLDDKKSGVDRSTTVIAKEPEGNFSAQPNTPASL